MSPNINLLTLLLQLFLSLSICLLIGQNHSKQQIHPLKKYRVSQIQKINFFSRQSFFVNYQSYLSAISLIIMFFYEGTIICKECTKLHASRAFVHYVPYVLSCNCFVRIFLFLRAFNFLRALRAVTFYVPYLTSFFTCFKCLHFFCMPYVPLFFTCLITCPHYMFDVPFVPSLFYKIWSNP